MSELQPIETAPKDGTAVLGFDSQGFDGQKFAVVEWDVFSKFWRLPVAGDDASSSHDSKSQLPAREISIMPFKKTGKDTYKSPSGKKFTGKQVRAYYASEGFSKPVKKGSKSKGKK